MEARHITDFVEWCDFLLSTCIKTGLTVGLDVFSVAEVLSTELGVPNFRLQRADESTYLKGTIIAFQTLEKVGLIEKSDRDKSFPFYSISKLGRDHIIDAIPNWERICRENLENNHEQVLHIVNQLSQKTAQDHAWLEMVSHEAVASLLGETDISRRLWIIVRELERWGFISGVFLTDGTGHYQSTYKGLVWETRRSFTLESKFIDDLAKEWETTSVDFKRELYTGTASQVAEFIKDVLSLATTKASGSRLMIIGFDDDTHDYDGPPDQKLNQDHFEQLLQEYTKPMVKVRYKVVDYRKGKIGKLEVFRDPKDLPYRVAKSLGAKSDKRRITEGQIFVRHGSQVEEPKDSELQDLLEEGNWARSMNRELRD